MNKKTLTEKQKNILFKEGVACYKIDDFVKLTGLIPTVIKIDVDGIENKIINGAKNSLKRPELLSLIVEINDQIPRDIEMVKYIEEQGFK